MTDTNQQTASLPRRGIRRRWIVLTVLLLIGAVFAGPYYWKVYRRHQARQFIVASGGFIMKGDAPFMMLCPSTPPPVTAPVSERIRFEWLEFWERRDVERRRQDCYSISVTAPGSRQPASRLLAEVVLFPELHNLNLSNFDLGDEDVRLLPRLSSLSSLNLMGCTFSGQSSVVSGELNSLRDIWIDRSLLTPQTIEQILKLRNLDNLRIRSSQPGEGQKVEEETMQKLHLALRECTIQVHDDQDRQLQFRHSFSTEEEWAREPPERPDSSVNSL